MQYDPLSPVSPRIARARARALSLFRHSDTGPQQNTGPHNGPRNTSLGLALLPPDRFGGVAGSGTITTTAVLVTGVGVLTVTADILHTGGSVRLGAVGESGLSVFDAVPITTNVTDAAVLFAGGKTFEGLIGKDVRLVLVAEKAMVYTVGFK
jgi:hypothetical protein